MAERAHIGLDNPAFSGRLRRPFANPLPSIKSRTDSDRILTDYVARQPAVSPATKRSDGRTIRSPRIKLRSAATDETSASIAAFVTANVLARQAPAEAMQAPEPARSSGFFSEPQTVSSEVDLEPIQNDHPWQAKAVRLIYRKLEPILRHYSPLQLALLGMACLVFLIGLFTSLQTMENNHTAAAQMSALLKQVNQKTAGSVLKSTIPATVKPTAADLSQYTVAPELARYIKIPKLGVDARVTQVGVTSSGILGIPGNINDAAWYNGSAKPGQPGATLIEGHISSWTNPGVFYNLKTLTAGDTIQVERGDGTVLNYQVVKTQAYAVNNVDMQAALTPITAGKAGLNLITCNGVIAPGTDSSQRFVVFAQQL